MSFFSTLKTWFSTELHALLTSIEPGLVYLEKNVPAALIKIAEDAILAGLSGGWAALLATIEGEAIAKGIEVTKQAIAIAANSAESNLIATGAIATPNAAPTTAAPVSA